MKTSLQPQPQSSPASLEVPRVAARRQRWAGTCILLLAAALAAAAVWRHGVVGADDFEFHLISWLDAQHSWRHGIVYPHWAVSPNFGAGEPRFVFYPPLTWMLGAALSLLLPATLLPAAMIFLLLAATGLATRAFATLALDEAASTLAGCAASLSGYALYAAFDRMAIGELAGGLWIPLVLLFILRDQAPQAPTTHRAFDGSAVPLALAVAGCWLSDAPVGVMGSYLLAGVALAAAAAARSWYPVLRAAVSTALGIGLAGVYLIPAAWEQRWVNIQQATGAVGDPGLRIENNWIFPHHTDPALHQRDLNLHWITPIAVFMIAMALASLLVLLLRKRLAASRAARARTPGALPRRLWLPLALIPPTVLFLLLPASLPLWNLLPKLRFLQFPWRWLLVVEAPAAVLFAAAVWPANAQCLHRNRARVGVAAACAVFLLGTAAFAAHNFFRDDPEDDDLTDFLARYASGAGFIGTDEYAPPAADNWGTPQGLPDACLTDDYDTALGAAPTPDDTPVWRQGQGSCIVTAAAQLRQPEKLRLTLTAPRACFLILRLRSFPAWRITLNGQPAPAAAPRSDGLIALPVEPGPIQVRVDWTRTPDVIASRLVSMLALLGLLALWRRERKSFLRRQVFLKGTA